MAPDGPRVIRRVVSTQPCRRARRGVPEDPPHGPTERRPRVGPRPRPPCGEDPGGSHPITSLPIPTVRRGTAVLMVLTAGEAHGHVAAPRSRRAEGPLHRLVRLGRITQILVAPRTRLTCYLY